MLKPRAPHVPTGRNPREEEGARRHTRKRVYTGKQRGQERKTETRSAYRTNEHWFIICSNREYNTTAFPCLARLREFFSSLLEPSEDPLLEVISYLYSNDGGREDEVNCDFSSRRLSRRRRQGDDRRTTNAHQKDLHLPSPTRALRNISGIRSRKR